MHKKLYVLLAVMFCGIGNAGTNSSAQNRLDWGDQGNGTYKNPVLNADYSDPDVIRVGSRYYMVASDFHFLGMQVLESEDLVNWHIISQIYRRFDLPGWDGNNRYAGGSWAPSIRYREGRFYVYFCTPHEGLFMSSAENPCGPWTPLHCLKAVPKWEDPCPLWDDDGQAYLGRSRHGAGPIIVHKMSADGKTLLDDGVTVYTGPVAEGTKWLKRNGWYYLVIPEGGVGTGWQTVLRSKNVYGPYEKRVVLEQGSTAVNGPHQGALVDTPEGEWWFFHFQSTPVLGRVVHLQPARWQDDWPLTGVDIDGNGIGEPVAVWTKPQGESRKECSLPQTSDDFNGPQLGLQWQWCHNPDSSRWSLTEHKGRLTLMASPSPDLKNARNMLTQKVMGYEGEATTQMDCRDLGKEAFAGMLCIGREFHAVGVSGEGICVETNGQREIVSSKRPSAIWLRIALDAARNRQQFYYSLDGKHYRPAGEPFEMQAGYWKGYRIGLFCYGENGQARFDRFDYEIKR